MKAPWRLAGLGLLLVACAPVPRPTVLGQVEAVRVGPAAVEAKRYASGAFAHAEKLRGEANQAAEKDDLAGAQILSERAIAAYAHAHALARVARAEAAAGAAESELAASEKELAALTADQSRVAAELDALDLRIKVARDAHPILPSGPADPEREKARLAASRALALQARLLCGAARLLAAEGVAAPSSGPAAPGGAAPGVAAPEAAAAPDPIQADIEAAIAAVGKVDADLATSPAAAPIDAATRARAGCLSVLTRVRRAGTPVSRAPGAGDALLAALSAAGTSAPSRDDRGVVVTLRGIFDKDKLSKAAEPQVADLGKVAAAHPGFPVVIVVHQDKQAPKDDVSSRARGEAVAGALRAAKAARVEVVLAGSSAPVVDPAGKDKARNARVEIVFVTPEAF
jgi:outer membrane protein OmpA-like peptidoglycan-associated protein